MEITKTAELLAQGGASLLATFIGALLAFKLTALHQRNQARLTQIEECNRTMIILARQYNLLHNHWQQQLKVHLESDGRHLLVGATMPLEPASAAINTPALAFLLSTKELDLVMDLALLDDKFRTCVDAINLRSKIHLEQYQPALEAVVAKLGTDRLVGPVVDKEIGSRLSITMRRTTDEVYEHVQSTLKALEKAGTEVPARFKNVFPKQKFIKFLGAEPTGANGSEPQSAIDAASRKAPDKTPS